MTSEVLAGPLDPEERSQWYLDRYTEIAALAGGLAHEIRNPLSTINLNLQLLAEEFEETENQRERRALTKIELLQNECRRLEEILSDFLRYARMSEPDLKTGDLNEVVHEMIDFFGPQAQQSGIVLRENLAEKLAAVRLDRQLFKQALLNLFLNAQQAMEEGGELMLTTRGDDHSVYLDVIDTGCGMSSETMQKIFKPFFSSRPGGSGLGLATTKKIVEAHGGKLHCQSVKGKGTAFTFQLPKILAAKPAEPKEPAELKDPADPTEPTTAETP